MITAKSILDAMSAVFQAYEQGDGVTVTTHCLFPSGEFVRVKVFGENETFVVSDEGRAVREIEAVGACIDDPDRTIKRVVTGFGLSAKNGIIRSRTVTRNELPIAIASVANGSRETAEWLFNHLKLEKVRDFKVLLRSFLELSFPANVHADSIIGSSNRPHSFDTIINLGDRKRIIIDPVTKDPAAINARVVANIDVQRAHIPELDQRIVYDDLEDWSAGELNLLQFGAPVIAYSNLPNVLPRLVNSH